MKSDNTKQFGFKISLALHLLVLVFALAVPWACVIRAKPKPPEPMTFVQIPISVRPTSLPDIPLPEPFVAEPPESLPIPEPVMEPLQKQEPKKVEPAKKPKAVEKQTNRVTKTNTTLEPPKQSEPLSEEKIREILAPGTPVSDPGVPGKGESNPILDGYYEQVFSRMYAAWIQPPQLRSLPGLSVDVRITVDPEGKILSRVKTRGSGNELMDDSVMKAVHSVKRLSTLPIGYRKPMEIIVTFVLGY